MTLRRICAVAGVLAAAACSANERRTIVLSEGDAAPGCEWHWGPTHDLLSFDGRPTYVDRPTLAHTDSGLLVVGTPSFFWATRTEFDPPPGRTASDSAAYLARLRDNHWYVGMLLDSTMRARGVRFPADLGGLLERAVVVQDDRGDVHLYWTVQGPDSLSLWHARRVSYGWSVPERFDPARNRQFRQQQVLAARADTELVALRARGVPAFARSGHGQSLLRVADDSVLMLWGEDRRYRGAPPEAPTAPISRFAWLTRDCAR